MTQEFNHGFWGWRWWELLLFWQGVHEDICFLKPAVNWGCSSSKIHWDKMLSPDLGGWWASNLDGFLPAKLLAYHFMQVSFFCNQKGGLLLSFESRTEIIECSPLLLQFHWASIFNSIAKKYTLFQWGSLLSGHTVKRCLVCYSACATEAWVKLENDFKKVHEPMKLNKMDHLQHFGVKIRDRCNSQKLTTLLWSNDPTKRSKKYKKNLIVHKQKISLLWFSHLNFSQYAKLIQIIKLHFELTWTCNHKTYIIICLKLVQTWCTKSCILSLHHSWKQREDSVFTLVSTQ